MEKDYSVRIDVENKGGSGILYVPKAGNHAYIMTAAHLFEGDKKEYEITVFFQGNSFRSSSSDCVKKIYCCQIVEDVMETENNRVFFLPNYKRDQNDSPDDGAIIEIDYEEWMHCRDNIIFGCANEDDKIIGYGYPFSTGRTRDKIDGTITNAVDEKIESGKCGDYFIRYNADDYEGVLPSDRSYLDGFSGTGFFIEKDASFQCVGICSRSIESSPRLYLTDIRKILDLLKTISPRNFDEKLFESKAQIKNAHGEYEATELKSVLADFLKNRQDFVRCLHGYAGVGKTHAVKYVEEICKEMELTVEKSWKKLVDCLSEGDISKIDNTVFVVDSLERAWNREARRDLSFFNIAEEEGYRRLTSEEKTAFFNKIWERERELKANNIHILITFRTNFLKDMCRYMHANRMDRRWERIENTFIDCIGYNDQQIQNIVGDEYPSYILKEDMIKRPRWMNYILDAGLGEVEEKGQYEYEFHVIHETIDWYLKKDDTEVFFTENEEDALSRLKEEYVQFVLGRQGREQKQWEEEIHFLLWCYPFKEGTDNTYEMDDAVLYCYFVAEELYELVYYDKEDEFKSNFVSAYNIGSRNNLIGNRIIAFFNLFFIVNDSDKMGVVINNWLLGSGYSDCLAWLNGTPEQIYEITYRYTQAKQKNDYMNTKQQAEGKEQISENKKSVELANQENVKTEGKEATLVKDRRKKNG